MAQTVKRETKGTPLRAHVGCHADPLVPATPCTLAESSHGKVLAMLAELVERGQAHLHAAICTRQGAKHITHDLCEISPRRPGTCCPVRARCNPVRARCNPAQAGPALGEARFRT